MKLLKPPSLPFSIPQAEIGQWSGRLTKGAALGFKAKVLLYAASPLFNDDEPYSREEPQDAVEGLHVWYGGYKPELWQRCLQACEDFLHKMLPTGILIGYFLPKEIPKLIIWLLFVRHTGPEGTAKK